MEFVSPELPRQIDGWHSPSLGLDMPIAVYGERGRPLLLFPTAAADFLENERFFLIKAIEPAILAGRVRVFSIESINRIGWMDRSLPLPEKGRRQALYSRYVEDEVVPYIRTAMGGGDPGIATAGASFGAFHAANAFFRRPDLFDALIAMSGFYDLDPDYLHGYHDANVFFNNPTAFLPGLTGPLLELLRTRSQIVVVTGQGQWEAPGASRRFGALLAERRIPHRLELWGHDVNHDWPWWRRMLPHYIDELGW